MANELSHLSPPEGSRRSRTRVGRGEGSGKGKTCGRGTKGAHSRSGSKRKYGFEGGQMPIYRRVPKKGFTNIFQKEYAVINLERLQGIPAGTTVDALWLVENGYLRTVPKDGVKVLGNGTVDVALHVRVAKVSKSAAAQILAAGGSIED